MNLAWRLAWRDLRGGLRGLRIVVACLMLGVGSIATVGSLRAGLDRGLHDQGRDLLGGDLEIESGADPLPPALATLLRARGTDISDVTTLRSLLAADGGERQLIDLKAVDPAYPLAGRVALLPPVALDAALATRDGLPGLVADGVALDRLGVAVGGTVRLGAARFRVAARLVATPDRGLSPLAAPPVLIAAAALPATGLVQPGSVLEHRLRVRLPAGQRAGATTAAIRAAFLQTGWRIRDTGQAAPGLNRFLDQVALFLTLAGLATLLVGGIGVGTGVRTWLDGRADAIAALRCLGASGTLIFRVVLIQVLAVAMVGIGAGLAIGAVMPMLLVRLIGPRLPIPLGGGPFATPLAIAALYGVLTALVFALPAVDRAARVPGAALFREIAPAGARRWRLIAAMAGVAAAMVGLTLLIAPQRGFALAFCAGAGATLLLFQAAGWGLQRIAAHLPRPADPAWRLGLGNLHRPGAPTRLLMGALGPGLAALTTVMCIESNIDRQLREAIPADAPSFYFIDLQPDQLAPFRALLAADPLVRDVRSVPSLRARIVAVAGVPAEQVRATPGTRWALRGDRGLTWTAELPAGSRITEGHWWPAGYAGPPLVSLDRDLAAGWGVRPGDTLRVNVLGRDLDLRVASLREIAWHSLGLNFIMVASPGLLAGAPHSEIATIRSAPREDAAILRRVGDRFPNVTGIRVADVLATVAGVVRQLGVALAATGSVALLAGGLVLAGALTAGQRMRVRDAMVLRMLGARRGQLRTAWLIEFATIGLAAGIVALLIGNLACWAVLRLALHADWRFTPWVAIATLAGCLGCMLLFGGLGAEAALRTRPGGWFRR